MKPLLELRRVAQSYGSTRVFSDLSLAVPSSEHLAVIGPSGCGKSTLLRLLAGLDAPVTGEVYLEGRLVARAGEVVVPPQRRGVAIVFQDLALWPNLSVRRNVWLGLAGRRLKGEERRRRVQAALTACGIPELAERKPAELSGGQQQRVALARALAVQPRILLLDEPFTALDLAIKAKLYGEIRRLTEQYGVRLVLVSHDLMEAVALCSFGVVLEDGAIQQEGPLAELIRHPASRTVQAFAEQLARLQNQAPAG